VLAATKAMAAKAVELIDMTSHKGSHPRQGAVDVVPFIPVREVETEEAVQISRDFGQYLGGLGVPVYYYEDSASQPERRLLTSIRKGEYEALAEKLEKPEWKPDFGPDKIHPTAGVTAIGARKPLVAFNVNLRTDELSIARDISRKVRHSNGGLRYCKAMGVDLEDRGVVQVSINMTDYTKTSLQQAFELIRVEADRHGVEIKGSEIVGLVPSDALIEVAKHYLKLEDFSVEQVIENRLLEDL